MGAVLSGKDTVTINNRILNDLADASPVELEFPNEIANLKTGKNGNSIFSLNETGRQCNAKIRVLRGSDDDKFFQALLTLQQADFSAFPLMIGEFIKKLGDGGPGGSAPTVTSDIYQMSGGVFSKLVPAKMNVEGDIEQSISMYELKFTNAPRNMTS